MSVFSIKQHPKGIRLKVKQQNLALISPHLNHRH
ncbi:hypothetical protein V6Z11_D11G380500 [Gossypium hirsutum]